MSTVYWSNLANGAITQWFSQYLNSMPRLGPPISSTCHRRPTFRRKKIIHSALQVPKPPKPSNTAYGKHAPYDAAPFLASLFN